MLTRISIDRTSGIASCGGDWISVAVAALLERRGYPLRNGPPVPGQIRSLRGMLLGDIRSAVAALRFLYPGISFRVRWEDCDVCGPVSHPEVVGYVHRHTSTDEAEKESFACVPRVS